jgi:hypothetical protein
MESKARKVSRGRQGARVTGAWLDEMAATGLTETPVLPVPQDPPEPLEQTAGPVWTGRRVFLAQQDPPGLRELPDPRESVETRATRATPDRPESP